MTLITHADRPEGRVVHKVLIEEALNIDRELYLGITLDRRIGLPVVMASQQGGMEIEEVAERDPKAIHREPNRLCLGVQGFQARAVANALGLTGDPYKKCVDFVQKLMRAYIETDASLAEINPLLLTKEGNVLALDCKMNSTTSALPAQGHRRDARPERGRSAGGRGVEVRAQLHQARRQCRLHGERRRPREWRRWTSSSWREASRRTSSTSAAAAEPPGDRSRTRSHHPSATKNVRQS